ncbi:exo-rhamnogalacturonan lyase family protein [Saccharopolyspora mangrovi]|uniref:Tat pathway signal sequence domain protein n=1 Tax=Saccharopolyspora mangrovi TaxID=3082379 RepID=A0ABU6A727_9PSEU|nr:hypothetical protein [Saccharopolyspora sp. S2-29]MEB3367263.1 hypothetical protein [Saccharopolyspora sp. S2-29]
MSADFSLSRRLFLGGVSAAAAMSAFPPASHAQNRAAGVPLRWLNGTPGASTGTAFGVPWPKAALPKDTPLTLVADGNPVPVQSWPLAHWPDGSVKWSGHAVSGRVSGSNFELRPGSPAAPGVPVTARREGGAVVLSNGTVEVHVATSGPVVLPQIRRGARSTATGGTLVLELQDKPEDSDSPAHQQFSGVVDAVEIERSGPVRAVVKVTGTYRSGGRSILPWTLRVYLGEGDESLRLVHSFVWDADENRDFVRGLGLRVSVAMIDEPHDRHLRFGTTEGGVWGEPVRVLTGLRRDPGEAVRRAQFEGTATPPVEQWDERVRNGYRELALWNDFTLFQESPRHFAVWKRTSSRGSWLKHAGRGERAAGFGYVGGASGGLGFGMRDFWQRFPRSFDVRGAAGETAEVTLWSYAPQAAAMDMRTYDTEAHGLGLAYEDVQEDFGSPHGMMRSTEMTLWALESTPDRDAVAALSRTQTDPPQLVADPRTYHAAGVFGRWSLPDRSTPARSALEDSIERDVEFYAGQVEQREWYGFWHHGDVMHTYDPDRHEWRYDVGGYAWDNAELGTDAMLWYVFLRTGDARTFRLAEAMTRHVAEVDTHHAGRFAGLGSRHAVVHWGDGAKEARVAEAYTKRFAHYLTADELLGDVLRSSLQADETLREIDPLRAVLPPQTEAPARLRIGPDWYALVSNWMTEWERTGDTRWRDRIVTGMRDIATFPAGLFTGEAGGAVGFDPATGHLTNFNRGDFEGSRNLGMAFLGEQILWEVLDLVDVPEFRQTYLDFARYGQAVPEEKIARYGRDFDAGLFPTIYSRVSAWAGEQLDDPALRHRGWQEFRTDPQGQPWPTPTQVDGPAVPAPVEEIPAPSVATNDAAQRILATITLLAVAPNEAP